MQPMSQWSVASPSPPKLPAVWSSIDLVDNLGWKKLPKGLGPGRLKKEHGD